MASRRERDLPTIFRRGARNAVPKRLRSTSVTLFA